MARWSLIICMLALFRCPCLLGQVAANCDDAVPICNNTPVNAGTQGYGTDDFQGAETSGCLEQTITGAIESNSAWYRFRTGAAGQLGFNIGFDTSEDWDFALYLASDCADLGDPIRCNFFDNQDQEAFMGVGEDPTGNPGSVLYEPWLQVAPGEDYFLLINNFTNNNSGFSIQFSGEIFVTNPYDALDCSIISNLLGPPIAACSNENIVLDATMANGQSYSWYMDTGSGFQLITGETNPTLQVTSSAMYRVEVVTLTLDHIISDVQVGFSPAPVTYNVSDESLCSDITTFDLSAKNTEALGPQNPSEVRVNYYRTLADAIADNNPLPDEYPLDQGSLTIYVRTTSAQNEGCFDVSRQFELNVVESPVFQFPREVHICEQSGGIVIGETTPDPRFSYAWDTGQITSSITVAAPGTYTVIATHVQAGITCLTTAAVTVVVSETPVIADVVIDDVQNNNTVEIVPGSAGNFEYRLDGGAFRPGGTFEDVPPGLHSVTINDLNGCGTVTENIIVAGFPKFFTPNGDGSNDQWNIIGISTLTDPVVRLYDRFGKLLKELEGNSSGWDGTFNGRRLPASDYWFRLTYTDPSGERVEARYLKNHFSLKR